MENVRGQFSEGVLTIYFSGRIDSNNVQEAEAVILSLPGIESARLIVIDAAELEYISSAGLRVILRLRKKYSNLKLINVSPEVYEILDMTGFTQMMTVEKAYRQVSIEGCEMIDKGANGTLYRIDKDNVVKVYNNPDSLEDIQHEREVAKIALVLGIPTAISYDVVRVGNSYGSVFELLNARSFAKILAQQPEKFDWCVKEYVTMLKRIHGTLVPHGKLPDMRRTALGWVEFLKDYLPEDSHKKLSELVNAVPEDDHMIHGDYHIKNLKFQDDEVLLIDMDTLAVGHPVFEMGSIYNAYIGFYELDPGVFREFLGIDAKTSVDFWRSFLKGYFETEDEMYLDEVEKKARIIGYTRLIRRSIRRKGLEIEEERAKIRLWSDRLIALLQETDSLLF